MDDATLGMTPKDAALAHMTRLWCELLAKPSVEPEDDFFKLGGDSLTAVKLTAHVNDAFGLDLDPIEVFDRPVLADFSAFVDASRTPA